MNGHTALIRSFGTTGVLLALSLVLLAIVSAIVAFDRWPVGTGTSAVERVAVERIDAEQVDTVVVRSQRRSPVVRGVVLVRTPGGSTSAAGSGGALPAGRDGSTLAGGPPPPRVPFRPPGEDFTGGGPRQAATGGGDPSTAQPDQTGPVQAAACGARDAIGAAAPDAGQALSGACQPGRRGSGPLAGLGEGGGPVASLLARVAGR